MVVSKARIKVLITASNLSIGSIFGSTSVQAAAVQQACLFDPSGRGFHNIALQVDRVLSGPALG